MANGDIGIVGLAVMGQNLALNFADHGYRVSVYNRSADRTRSFLEQNPTESINAFYSLSDLVASLVRPRRILLMVSAAAVDPVLLDLLELVEPGDLIMDGGNSFFEDTIRREALCREKGVQYLGVGISGGEMGARHGPSLMPGGDPKAYHLVEDLLTDIAAKAADGSPCCAYLGPGGTGHFVKMVHNGIEYALMQAIAECYALMRHHLGMGVEEIANVFDQWNQGELGAYLIEITVHILRRVDATLQRPLVDVVLDAAEQKGTGMWTVGQSLDLGVPTPTLAEALYARYLSALHLERQEAAKQLQGPAPVEPANRENTIRNLREALYAAMICIYAQGFALLRQASRDFGWELDLETVAKIWRNGCIIRAKLLAPIAQSFAQERNLKNLLLAEPFRAALARAQASWRSCVCLGITSGIAIPALGSALAYYDGYRTHRSSASLIQLQRDYFGSHTYRRIDKPGYFHTDWSREEEV